MNETEFHSLADTWIAAATDMLEEEESLDVEHFGGILTIIAPSEKTLVISKHAPNRELWLASPVSGGLHFSYDAPNKQWSLADGRTIEQVLSEDLKSLAGLDVAWK